MQVSLSCNDANMDEMYEPKCFGWSTHYDVERADESTSDILPQMHICGRFVIPVIRDDP